MAEIKPSDSERLMALELHMEYTVKGIDDLKDMMKDHSENPCEKCTLADEVAVTQNDIVWIKRLAYIVGMPISAGIIGLIIDRFTGFVDKITKAI